MRFTLPVSPLFTLCLMLVVTMRSRKLKTSRFVCVCLSLSFVFHCLSVVFHCLLSFTLCAFHCLGGSGVDRRSGGLLSHQLSRGSILAAASEWVLAGSWQPPSRRVRARHHRCSPLGTLERQRLFRAQDTVRGASSLAAAFDFSFSFSNQRNSRQRFLILILWFSLSLLSMLEWRVQLLDHASLHTHNHTITLSPVLVVMMNLYLWNPRQRSILMLILWISLSVRCSPSPSLLLIQIGRADWKSNSRHIEECWGQREDSCDGGCTGEH